MQSNKASETVRIIAGQWRGRKLSFPRIDGLRPTGDRARETVFNWLMHDIPGSYCCDAFAGSGALGFEALSRGAAQVVFLDNNQQAFRNLQDNAAKLEAKTAHIYQQDAVDFFTHTIEPFDIIFLDPPFSGNHLAKILNLIKERRCLKDDGLVYIECAKEAVPELAAWRCFKSKTIGHVRIAMLGAA